MAGLLASTPALAQSATATLSAPTTDVAPGSSVTVSLVIDYSTGAAGSGVFGSAGLYGFGGTIETSGAAASSTGASSAMISGSLPFGSVAETSTGGSQIARAASGRTLGTGGLTGSSETVLTFSVDIDAGAMSGDTVTLQFDGAVLLALDDSLTTYSTDPGANQASLTSNSLTLTVGGGRLCADVNGDGVLDPADFTAWLGCFGNPASQPFCDPNADVNQSGAVDPADFTAWLSAFNAGLNGPICSP